MKLNSLDRKIKIENWLLEIAQFKNRDLKNLSIKLATKYLKNSWNK